MITKDETQVKPQWYNCDVCDGEWLSSTPPEAGAKLYEIHGCFKGKRKAQQDAITCKQCGRVTGPSQCGCPEQIAQRKADAVASDKKDKEDNARYKLNDARFEKERADKRREENELSEKQWKETIAAGRKEVKRAQLDVELRDREQALKARELTRSEQRLDNYDAAADEAQVEDADEPLAAFETPMDGSDLDIAPTAMLQRMDGATLFYKEKLNFLFGTPGSGKSWVALDCVHETLLQGHRAIYWDHEDTAQAPSTGGQRSSALTLRTLGGRTNSSTCGLDWTTLP